MNSEIYGIDPGENGCIARLKPDNSIALLDLKSAPIHEVLDFIAPGAVVVVEDVCSFGMGRQSAFNFGRGLGRIDAALEYVEANIFRVQPAIWKRALHLTGLTKTDAIALAQSFYPQMAPMLRRKKDHDRAEAILIAHYFRESLSPEQQK